MKKKILLCAILGGMFISCGSNSQPKGKNIEGTSQTSGISDYLDTLKSENSLKITMGGKPVTIVGKELKVGDKINEVPLTVNRNLEDKNIFEEKAVKVLYTAPSLDTKVCSVQTKMLNDAAAKYPAVKFYSITMDTPFAQERFCTDNGIHGLKAVSDFKYHQFGLRNGFYVKESGLLARALTIVDENNVVKYIEYVPEQGKEADVEKALKFLEEKILEK